VIIGSGASSEYWSGSIRGVAIHKPDYSAITPADLATALYNSGVPLKYEDASDSQISDWGVTAWGDGDDVGARMVDKHGSNDATRGTAVGELPALVSEPARHYTTFRGLEAGQYNDALYAAHHADHNPGNANFLVAVLCRANVLDNWDTVFSKYDLDHATQDRQFCILMSDASPREWRAVFGNGVDAPIGVSGDEVEVGEWVLIVAYHDADNDLKAISINGAAVTTAAHTGGLSDCQYGMKLGAMGAGGSYTNHAACDIRRADHCRTVSFRDH